MKKKKKNQKQKKKMKKKKENQKQKKETSAAEWLGGGCGVVGLMACCRARCQVHIPGK